MNVTFAQGPDPTFDPRDLAIPQCIRNRTIPVCGLEPPTSPEPTNQPTNPSIAHAANTQWDYDELWTIIEALIATNSVTAIALFLSIGYGIYKGGYCKKNANKEDISRNMRIQSQSTIEDLPTELQPVAKSENNKQSQNESVNKIENQDLSDHFESK